MRTLLLRIIFTILCGCAIGYQSFAGIIVTNIDFRQTNPLTTDWTKAIDINNDGLAEFTFSGFGLFHNLLLEQETNTSLACSADITSLNFLQQGDSVNAALDFTLGSFLLVRQDTLHMPSNAITYIGFELLDELHDKVYFGWISIKYDNIHRIFYIYDAAFNDMDGKSIAAGQTGVTIPENPLKRVRIYSREGVIYFDYLPADFRGLAYIYDIQGKLLTTGEISIRKNFLTGLYRKELVLVMLVCEEERFSVKYDLRE